MGSIAERGTKLNQEQGETHRIPNPIMSRRRFIQGTVLLVSAEMIAAACGVPRGAPGATTPDGFNSTMSPGIVENSPLPHIDTLSGDTFTRTFSNFDDATKVTIPNTSGTITKSGKDLASFASEVWNDNISTTTVSRNSMHAFELALSSADMTGKDGTIDMSQIFPELSLKLSRLNLSALPNGKDTETAVNVFPKNLVLRKGMNMIVVGVDDSTKEAIVAFEDTLRKSDKTPTMYLSALPLEIQGETDGQISLNELLARNGAAYDSSVHSILYENGQLLTLNSLDSTLSRNLHQAAGSYFIDLDPLKKNKDGTPAFTTYPIVAPLPANLVGDKISQLNDGRIAVLDGTGKTVARARYSFSQNGWEWATDTESLQDFTLREIADANGLTIATFGDINYLTNTDFINSIENAANRFTIAEELNPNIVFENFTSTDWGNIISNWSSIEAQLNKGVLPDGFNYKWALADKMIAFAKKEGMKIKAQHLLGAGDDSPVTVTHGGFNNSDLVKILEFMVKTRVIKYKEVIDEWEGANEVVTIGLFGSDVQKFWLNKLGTGIVDKVYTWAHQADPRAKLSFTEDHILDGDSLPEVVQGYLGYLKHFKQNNVPVDQAVIENNMWIYTPPDKNNMIRILKQIEAMGYKIGAAETTVMITDQDFTDPQRPRLVGVTDKLQAQAKVYQDVLEAYLAVGAEFGIGGVSDAVSWFNQIGQPDTKTMIFDDNWQPKPAYFALLAALKNA